MFKKDKQKWLPNLPEVFTGTIQVARFQISLSLFQWDNLSWSFWREQTAEHRVFTKCTHTLTLQSPEERISEKRHSLFYCKLG